MKTVAARLARLPQLLAARLAALPPRRQELVQDTGLGVALAAVNVVSLLPYRAQLHPLWLALTLVAAQGIPLIWRRSRPIGVGLVIGAARVAYDKIGFGFAPFPLGPAIAFYIIIDRRGPVWRWGACVLVAAGIAISEAGSSGCCAGRPNGWRRRPRRRSASSGRCSTRSAAPACLSIWRSWAHQARWRPAWT